MHIVECVMERKPFLAVLMLCFSLEGFCEGPSIHELMSGYLRNSLSLLSLSADIEDSFLVAEAARISNGIGFQISTGTVQVSGGDGLEVSFLPQAEIVLPKASNLALSVSSDVEVGGDEKTLRDTSLAVGVDVLSGSRELSLIEVEEGERAVLEARRALQNGFVTAETDFFRSLRDLYEIAATLVAAQRDLYEDSLEFEQIKAQGYSSSSSRYRLAQIDVLTDEQNVSVYQRSLERETKIFASECGIEYTGENVLEFLPSEIPQMEPVEISSFPKEDFAETENARWTLEINSRRRKANRAVSVSANAGYTFDKEIHSGSFRDTVDMGTALTWNGSGFTASAGVSFPVDGDDPVYSFGLGFSPDQHKLFSISKEQEALEEQKESIAVSEAEKNYELAVVAQSSSLTDILWNKTMYDESYDLYTQLESDMALYFDQGIITESEYRSAQVNKENSRIQRIINAIDLIIYNNETMLYFVRDEELMR